MIKSYTNVLVALQIPVNYTHNYSKLKHTYYESTKYFK